MIYVESFRHFVQEWIEIQHPRDLANWPWNPNSRLFLLNLYSVSGSEEFMDMPNPFISILINNLEKEQPWLTTDEQSLYKGHFEQDIFKLPRKYLFNPLNRGERNFHTNRYSYTSDGYGDSASNWSTEDMRLVRILGHRQHVRYSIYDSEEYALIRNRMNQLEEKSCAVIRIAENLFDCTDYADKAPRHSPSMMLIAAPVLGIVKPMRKSKDYRIINGALIMCNDPVQISISTEPCNSEYAKERIPFANLVQVAGHRSTGTNNEANAIVYIAVEAPSGIFTFQEMVPSNTIESARRDTYARVINHQFTVAPESNPRNQKIEVRLHHVITESLMAKVKENNAFFARRNEKLFHRSDMPPGFTKSRGGDVITVSMPVQDQK